MEHFYLLRTYHGDDGWSSAGLINPNNIEKELDKLYNDQGLEGFSITTNNPDYKDDVHFNYMDVKDLDELRFRGRQKRLIRRQRSSFK